MKSKYYEICVIGLGPAGLGALVGLARSRFASNTVCLEAGMPASGKFCKIIQGEICCYDQPCQVISGVGGSSVLSGGKISAFPAGRGMSAFMGGEKEAKDKLQKALLRLQEYAQLTPPQTSFKDSQEAIAKYQSLGFEFRYYDAYLYRQADLETGYSQMLAEAVTNGVSIHLETKVNQITISEEGFHIVAVKNERPTEFFAKRLILGVGRSGAGVLNEISSSLALEKQPNRLDIGIRLEFPASLWPDIDHYHNDLKLHFKDARTFCVCKNGSLAPYRIGDIFILDGRVDPNKITGFTNLAIMTRQQLESNEAKATIFKDIRQRLLKQTGGRPIRQRLIDYLAGRPSQQGNVIEPASISYWHWGDANSCLSEATSQTVRESVEYFVCRLFQYEAFSSISVFAPELEYYWPKFLLFQGFRSQKPNLYLIGDCSGQFRGILQAFCSGLECAESIFGESYV